MKKKIKLTEQYLHKVVNESLKKILREDNEGDAIFYEPQGSPEEGFSDENEEWENSGLDIYSLYMVKDPEIAKFHFSPVGYTIYYEDEEFGEAWYEKSDGCYHGVSDNDIFNGYTRIFIAASLNGLFEDIMDKASESDDEDEDDEY
jgi:hypothetical protein